MTPVDPRHLVGRLWDVRQRTLQVAGAARMLARHIIESESWPELPEDARREWVELENRADRMFEALKREETNE